MSGLAKAFVVINLILALFFLGASATLFRVQEGWKGAAEDLDAKVSKLEVDFDTVIQQKDGVITSYQDNNKTLGTENELLKAKNQDLTDANGDLKNDVLQKESRLNLLEGHLAQKDAHIADKEGVIAQKEETIVTLLREKAEADESAKDAIALANRARIDRQEVAEQLEQMAIQYGVAETELEDTKLMLAAAKRDGWNGTLGVAQPKIDAVVVAVRDGIVVLSVGRDDNVKTGYEFTVYEGSRFIGKVKVENVLGDMSGARVLFTEKNESIQAGNQASTRLSG